MNPPISAPAMPIRMVTIIPPGSRPGISSLAMTPTIKPKTIHPMIPNMFTALLASPHCNISARNSAGTTMRLGVRGRSVDGPGGWSGSQ
jgi:hypothetical protein